MPKFSIIIPVYNVAPYLRECLDSVLAQTYTDWEAICVDDGSTDGSGAILDEYRAKDGRFKVVHSENQGPGQARNLGIKVANGQWLCFLDGDDLVRECWLDQCCRAIKSRSDVDIFRYRIVEFEDGSPCKWCLDDRLDGCVVEVFDLRYEIKQDVIRGFFLGRVYRREVASFILFPEFRLGEDWVWKIRALLRASMMADIDAHLYGYRQRSGSAMNSPETLFKLQDGIAWPVEVLKIMENADRVIDQSFVRWLSAVATEGFSARYFTNRRWRRQLWLTWISSLRTMSRFRLVPLWFKMTALVVSRTKSPVVAYVLFYIPQWLKLHGVHR